MRKIKDTDFVGKTISSIENNSFDVVKFTFTDGTTIKLVIDQWPLRPAGRIPSAIYVIEERGKVNETY